MKEYKIGNATVRIHGSTDHERLKEATHDFLKKAERQRKERLKNEK